MTLHILKLCVGVDTLQELAEWQAGRLKDLKKKGKPSELVHVTRMTPSARTKCSTAVRSIG
jgi:hypothetical protein